MVWKSSLIFGALMLLAHGVQAQEAGCEALLRDGVRDYAGSAQDYFRYEKFKSWLAQDQSSTLEQAKQSAQNIGLGYEGFELKFGLSDANSNYQQWRNSFLSSSYHEILEQSNSRTVLKVTNEALVNAFEKCIRKRFGVSVWIDASSDTEFAIFFQFNPPEGSNQTKVNVVNFSIQNAKCNQSLERIKTVGPVASVLCKKSNRSVVAAVSLSTTEYGPKVQPKFGPISIPPVLMGVTIAGNIYGSATRLSQHAITFTMATTPSEAELRKGILQGAYVWKQSVERTIDAFDFVSNPQIMPSSAEVRSACSVSEIALDKKDKKLTINWTNSCTFLNNNNLTKAFLAKWLLEGNFIVSANIIMENRVPVLARSKQIAENNSTQSSWSFRYDIERDSAILWTYAFDVGLTSGGASYRLFRSADGKQQQLASGPFRAVFSDSQVLTIYRESQPSVAELKASLERRTSVLSRAAGANAVRF